MESEIKISIVVPVYNVEKYLKQCLDSILAQTFQEFEVVCVDDGSSDCSLEILQEYAIKDNRINILQQRHAGAYQARNLGLKTARGKYIQFLDSDDYFEQNLLEEMYKHAELFNAEITICSSRKIDENGDIIETNSPNFPINIDKIPMKQVFNKKDFKEDIFCLLTPIIWNKLYLKEFLEKNFLQFPSLPIYEDIAFAHSTIASANRIIAFNQELVNYRCNRAGSLASKRSQHTIEAVKSCLCFRDYLISKNLFEELKIAYNKMFINNLRAEISYCNDEEYSQFLGEFKNLLGDNWREYQQDLRKDYITPEYLKRFIGNKKVVLWGASLFLGQVLEKEKNKNVNILGIIDRNPASKGKQFYGYTIYSPEEINNLKPDGIILTVLSNNETIYESLKQEINEKYPNIELLPNIFEKELV